MDFIEEIIALYGKECAAHADYLMAMGADFSEGAISDGQILPDDWFNVKAQELGMSPHEYVKQGFGGEITADNAIRLFDAFAVDNCWAVPEGVAKLLEETGEQGKAHVLELLCNADSFKKSYYETTDENVLKEQDRVLSIVNMIASGHFVCDEVKDCLWKAFDECIVENEAIIENVSDSVAEAFGAQCVAQKLSEAQSIGFKELTLMQSIVNSDERSDELYRCLRRCVKLCGQEERLTALSIFADYGDPRAVTLLRSVAKEMKEKLVPGVQNDIGFQELYIVASMINKLGGNTEDIIGM